jgi:hypothetical protein
MHPVSYHGRAATTSREDLAQYQAHRVAQLRRISDFYATEGNALETKRFKDMADAAEADART